MEKRKVFKISIIDKEISRTEFDRNTFYTSDSELTLVFKLIEKDYSYEHGEILLYNENDKSFVTRKITKQDNDFVYELDLDIIPHYGKWKAQLQLINDGDVYTSKPFEFVIENDLSNLAPQPTLTDINNWATLKQSANELIDEMRDVIVDVERGESERASNENYRKQGESVRENKENIRLNSELKRENQESKRLVSESERENNERKRRIAEFERLNKENSRQHAESQRQSTFETNETERQNKFESAEQERQSAELTRIENENQRKTDHANRSSELDGKADKVILNNLIDNGDFSDGTTGWVFPSRINGEVINGKLHVKTDINEGQVTYPFISKISKSTPGNIMYYIVEISEMNSDSVSLILQDKSTSTVLRISTSGTHSIVRQMAIGSSLPYLYINHILNPGQFIDYKIDHIMTIDLTQTFGAGNEPTKEEMDELIKVTGYIDSEYALDNKEMLIWTLALVRRNKNAIITLGGTI